MKINITNFYKPIKNVDEDNKTQKTDNEQETVTKSK